MKFYIACSLANVAKHNELRNRLIRAGHEITFDWTEAPSLMPEDTGTPWWEDTKRYLKLTHAFAQRSTDDLNGVLDADVVFTFAPGGIGTQREIGAALALGIPVIMWAETQEDVCAPWRDGRRGYPTVFDWDALILRRHGSWESFLHGLPDLLPYIQLAVDEPTLVSLRRMGRHLDRFARACFNTAVSKGWWDDGVEDRDFPTKLMLMVSELSEALEHYRNGKDLHSIFPAVGSSDGKPDGVPIELADVAIRIGDACGAYAIPIGRAVAEKMAYNRNRRKRHGGKAC